MLSISEIVQLWYKCAMPIWHMEIIVALNTELPAIAAGLASWAADSIHVCISVVLDLTFKVITIVFAHFLIFNT